MKILPVGTELLNLTERHLTKLIVVFRKFAKAVKKLDKYSGIDTNFISSLQFNYSIILIMVTCFKHTGHRYVISCYKI